MVQINNLSKSFNNKAVVRNLNFEVYPGQVLGLLGPNGAGKSTAMKMIVGVLTPTAGSVSICGYDIQTQPRQAKASIGYLPESAPAYQDLTVEEFLNYFAHLKHKRNNNVKRDIQRVVDLCFLEEVRNQSMATLSKGYVHRSCLAQSLLNDPPVIIFDEPTDGLDPNQKREIRSMITEMAESKAIIMSTHILDEVESVCSDVLLLNNGVTLHQSPIEDFRKLPAGAQELEVTILKQDHEDFVENMRLQLPKDLRFIEINRNDHLKILVIFPSPDLNFLEQVRRSISCLALKKQWLITEMATPKKSLEDVFYSLTTKNKC